MKASSGRSRVYWPLFSCLKPGARDLLKKYQQDNFPAQPSISPPPANSPGKWENVEPEHLEKRIESLAKIARLMKETPRHVRRVVK